MAESKIPVIVFIPIVYLNSDSLTILPNLHHVSFPTSLHSTLFHARRIE